MDNVTLLTLLIALISGLGGLAGLASFIRVFSQNKKDKSDADLAISQAWKEIFTTIVEPLKERVKELESKVECYEVDNYDLKAWAEELVAQVIELGGKPKKFTRRSKKAE